MPTKNTATAGRNNLAMKTNPLERLTCHAQSFRRCGPARPSPSLRQLIGIGFFLLAVVFVTGDVGSISRPLGNFVVLCLLLGFLLVFLPLKSVNAAHGIPAEANTSTTELTRGRRYRLGIYLVILFAASSALVLTQNRTVGLLGLSILVFGLDLISRKVGVVRRELAPLLLTVILYSLFLMLLDYVPQLWRLLNSVELLFSSGVGHIWGSSINLAATYSGLNMVALFVLYFASAFAFSQRRNLYSLICLLLSLIAIEALYLVFWVMIFSSSLPRRLELAQPFISTNDFRLLLFILLLIPTFFLLRSFQLKAIPLIPNLKQRKSVALALVLLLLAVALLAVQPPGARKAKDIVFYGKGSFDWRLPDFSRFGLKDIGMFGLLPKYLAGRGYLTRIESKLTKDTLDNAGTLVLINLNEKLNTTTKNTVWKFIHNGGSLLVLGDHTGREVIREPYNDLLRRVGIAFNFDSAIPIADRWQGGFQLRPHPLFDGIAEDELQINIGASLSTSSPSRPLIIGRYGFSDKGNILAVKNGYLGDMKYSRDERLGDLVLAAEANYGSGKVLAFGDTTSFQNGVLMRSYRFVDNTFTWLSTNGRNRLYPYNIPVALVLLAASLVLLLSGGRSTLSLTVFTAILALGLLVSSGISGLGISDHGRLKGTPAIIDISHLERCSLNPFSIDSIDGLGVNLIRNAYVPLLMKEFSGARVMGAKLLVIVAPAKEFSPSEIRVIRKFVEGGGLLILTTGSEEFAGSRSLSAEFGLGVGDTPLGRVIPGDSAGISLWKAWPVISEGQSHLEVLARAWDDPVIVFRRLGRGGVIVAGDSYFLLNRNLEQINSYNEGNINFLKECLGRFKKGNLGK